MPGIWEYPITIKHSLPFLLDLIVKIQWFTSIAVLSSNVGTISYVLFSIHSAWLELTDVIASSYVMFTLTNK